MPTTMPATDSPKYQEWAERRARALLADGRVPTRTDEGFVLTDEKFANAAGGPEITVWRDGTGHVVCNCPLFVNSEVDGFRCEHIFMVKFWLAAEKGQASAGAEVGVGEGKGALASSAPAETPAEMATRIAAEKAAKAPVEVDSDPLGYIQRNEERRDKKARALAAMGHVGRTDEGFEVTSTGTRPRVDKVARGVDGIVRCTCTDFQNAMERAPEERFRCEHILAVKYYLEPPTPETLPPLPAAPVEPSLPPPLPESLGPLPAVATPVRVVTVGVYGPAPRVEYAEESDHGTARVRFVYDLEVPLVSVGHVAFSFALVPEE